MKAAFLNSCKDILIPFFRDYNTDISFGNDSIIKKPPPGGDGFECKGAAVPAAPISKDFRSYR